MSSSLRVLSLLGCVLAVHAQESQWLTPDGSQPDFSEAYNNADLVEIAWNEMSGSLCDLWLTAYDADYAIRVASNINIAKAGTYPWTITVGDEEIAIQDRFALHFIPTGTNYNQQDASKYESSPGFLLVKAGDPLPSLATNASQSAEPTASISTTINVATTSAGSIPSDSPSDASSSSGFGPGAKAGVAIAVVAGLAAILGLLFWALRLRRKVKAANNHRSSGVIPASGMMQTHHDSPANKRISGVHEVAGDANHPVEISARPKTVYYELSG